MGFIKTYNEKIIKYDLVNKFPYNSNENIPRLKKITLNFGCKNFNIQRFATTLLALEILTSKKATLSASKNANILLKIQKGQPAGCKIILVKKEMYFFLTKLHLDIFPKLRNFPGFKLQTRTSSFFFQLPQNQITLPEFDSHYPLFSDLPNLDINVLTNSRNQRELFFFAESIKLPLKKKNSDQSF